MDEMLVQKSYYNDRLDRNKPAPEQPPSNREHHPPIPKEDLVPLHPVKCSPVQDFNRDHHPVSNSNHNHPNNSRGNFNNRDNFNNNPGNLCSPRVPLPRI